MEQLENQYRTAKDLYDKGDWSTAAEVLRQLKTDLSKDASAQLILLKTLRLEVCCYGSLNDLVQAKAYCQQMETLLNELSTTAELAAKCHETAAFFYSQNQQYDKSIAKYLEYVQIMEIENGKGHPSTFPGLVGAACWLISRDLKKAGHLLSQAFEIVKNYGNELKAGNVVNYFTAQIVYRDRFADYRSVHYLTKEAVKYAEKYLPPDHPDLLKLLADSFLSRSLHFNEQEMVEKLNCVLQRQLTSKRPDFELADTYRIIGTIYLELAELEEAENCFLRSYKLAEKNSLTFAYILFHLSKTYLKKGILDKSESFLTHFLNFDLDDPGLMADGLTLKAKIMAKQGHLKEAIEIQQKALDIQKQYLGSNNLSVIGSYYDLAYYYARSKEFDFAYNHIMECLERLPNFIIDLFGMTTEREQFLTEERFDKAISLALTIFFSFSPEKQPKADKLWSQLLFRKGLILRFLIYKRNIERSDVPHFKALSERLALKRKKFMELRATIADLQLKFLNSEPSKAEQDSLQEREEKQNEIEREAAQLVLTYTNGKQFLNKNPREIIIALSNEQVLIDCFQYEHCLLENEEKSQPRYCFMIVCNNDEIKTHSALALPINNGIKLIEDATSRYFSALLPSEKKRSVDNYYAWSLRVYDKLIEPLISKVSGKKRWTVCADSLLHSCPWGLLKTPDGSFTADKFEIGLITHPTDLLHQVPPSPTGASAIFAAPDFGHPPDNSSDSETRSARPTYFTPLPYSMQEAEVVSTTLRARYGNEKLQMYVGNEATVSRLKAVSSPYILHIATHGFLSNYEQYFSICNSDYSSYLAFAGANIEKKGIISAVEIGELNLKQTYLVTLASCDTASGKIINAEGIFNLCRAFKYAGALNIISSRWKVPDREAKLFMEFFYSYLVAGENINRAFYSAKQELRRIDECPFIWGAFVLLSSY